MDAINFAGAKIHLGTRINQIETGDSVDIARQDKPASPLPAVVGPRRPVDAALLWSLSATMTPQLHGAGDLVRSIRDNDRY